MKIQVILTDLQTDGSAPIDCDITVDNREELAFLKLKLEDIHTEIAVSLYDIGLVLGNEEHG